MQRAARLAGVSDAAARADRDANIRAGAALLADSARRLGGGRLPTSLAGWYPAVVRYLAGTDTPATRQFADDVYATLRSGATGSTVDGQLIRLAPQPGARPDHGAAAPAAPATVPAPECPAGLDCRFVPAAYTQNTPGDPTDYGNYDYNNRPADLKIRYIVIHDTETTYNTAIAIFQNPLNYVSAHYVIRSSDGQITQMVRTKDVAWHAGNWYVNMHSIGIEHEGIAEQGATWYTEAMYRASARLVAYLAHRFNIPLDRQHIIGHDNVPGPAPGYTAGMHWDPGPYWDWSHYMALIGAPIRATAGPRSTVVTIAPGFAGNRQTLSTCDGTATLPRQPTSFVYLRTAPSVSAPLFADPTIHSAGQPGSTRACDWGDQASAGQQFAVAGHQGDWTGIWYEGQEAWFFNPVRNPRALPGGGWLVTPRPGLASIPVYGRAYPEASAYPADIAPQTVVPIEYTITAGQRYVLGDRVTADYYYAKSIDDSIPDDHTVVRGTDRYYQIQLGHRIAFVRASDVVLRAAGG
ncbi:MAG: N-acetylmuramoyl-L-alanine amidase [Actinomycetota bacterium]|nr:N-acetylmuramoyl-L-alanine amidase [Actinomycetota bacterium]